MTTENGEATVAEVGTHQPETTEAVGAEPAASEVQAAYDRIANPEKAKDESEAAPTAGTPPESVLTNERAQELLTQVARIPDLEKRLRDEGGRYGALKQQIEQLQERIATATTAGEVAANSADAGELLADLRDEFPELADKLQGAFSKVMASRGGIDPGGIEKLVSERLEAARQKDQEAALEQLTEAHPDWIEVRAKPEFQEWKATLPDRVRARFERSQDPFYVSEMLDQHKDWLNSRAKQPSAPAAQQPASQPNRRLAAATVPNGTKAAPKGEPDAKASIWAGYEKVAGKRM